jgi:hypothetical protein
MINLREWLNARLERQTHAETREATEIASTAELLSLHRAMKIRLHMDELQSGTLARVDNVVSFAAHATRAH